MPSGTALLIIDMQVGLVDLIPTEIRNGVLSRIEMLLKRARESATPVIHVQHDGPEGHPLETHTPGWDIYPSVRPAEGETVIRKRTSDSFFETSLQQELERNRITLLAITGGRTEYCVDTTCRRATTLGYDVVLVSDGHLTRDNVVLKATQIIAHHNTLLAGFATPLHRIQVTPAEEVAL